MYHLIDSLIVAMPAALAVLLLRFWYKKGFYQADIIALQNQQQLFPKFAERKSEALENTQYTVRHDRTGNDFERFIIDRFDTKHFELLEWRSDKIQQGIYSIASMLPDMRFRFSEKNESVEFTVECKWRPAFTFDKIKWAKDYQLLNYRKFEHAKNIPVFVIIGIGGSPVDPEEVYIIPLDRIQTTHLSRQQLNGFRRQSTQENIDFRLQSMMLA